ncbi:MAG: hypothetical protein EXR73_12055 [Myxococcales bacterium]|nr:hypothetical protein [Myxococcales bacterium]
MKLTLAVLAVAVALASLACERPPAEVNGVGEYVLGKTLRRDMEGKARCEPINDGKETHCMVASSIRLGAQAAQTSLYFQGTAPASPLLEIALTVRVCRLNDAIAALVGALGDPSDGSTEKLRFWRLGRMFVSAKLPAKGGIQCEVNFVTTADKQRVADLEAGE